MYVPQNGVRLENLGGREAGWPENAERRSRRMVIIDDSLADTYHLYFVNCV